VIKIATAGRAISELEETAFRGAALAQRATGLAITTHTTLTALAVEQVDLLVDAGADLDRTVIGHIGWGTGPEDRDLHVALAERGVLLGLDMVGLPARSLEQWVQIALDLVDAGHADRILLSHDNCAHARGLLDVYGPEWLTGDFTIVHRQLVPRLRAEGVEEAVLQRILVDNPRRLLTIEPSRYPGAAAMLESIAEPV
jgi:phosphotriesterase-related protein